MRAAGCTHRWCPTRYDCWCWREGFWVHADFLGDLESRKNQVNRQWIIWYAVALHLWWSVMLILSPSPCNITAIAFLHNRFNLSRTGMAILFSLVAMIAWTALLEIVPISRFMRIALLIPQQFMLLLSAGGAIQAMIRSSFADGVQRPWPFIASDQFPAVLVAICHTCAILERRRGWHPQT